MESNRPHSFDTIFVLIYAIPSGITECHLFDKMKDCIDKVEEIRARVVNDVQFDISSIIYQLNLSKHARLKIEAVTIDIFEKSKDSIVL